MTPKVSILVPIYNVEKYLKQCLDSVINQTLKDIEIICINDGSTDSSLQILQEYQNKDNRIKIINKENSGYGASMNRGLDAAQGEYIGIVESDDFVKDIMFEDLYNLAIENNLDLIKSDFYFYIGKTKLARQACTIKKKKAGKILSVKDDVKILTIMPSIWSSLYKREFLNKNNIRFLETPGASYQDTSFAFKAFATAKSIMLTHKAYLYYRQDNENSSVKCKDKVFVLCKEWEEISRYIDERPELKAIVNDIKVAIQFNSYKWNTLRIDEKFRDSFIEEYHKQFKSYKDNNQIKDIFYQICNENDLKLLLENKSEFKKYIDCLSVKEAKKAFRQKNFSIRINPSKVSIILFGKQLLELG